MTEFASPLFLRDHEPASATGWPAVLSRSQTRWLLFGLLLLTVLPRALTAWRLEAVCDDAYFYQWVATMWEQGRTATALKYLNLNLYPLILWGLESAGLSWPLSGQLWGVLVAGLTVFPLFGLMRRMFDDRVAAVCVFLYAVHPGLIELSAEPIREPTFWFLFLLSADWIHRSGTATGNWRWPVAAGMAVALAVHTRTEGWVLLAPLCVWPITLAAPTISLGSRVLRIGVLLAMIPLLLLGANLALLRDHDRWEWGRFAPLQSFVDWLPSNLKGEVFDPFLPKTVAAVEHKRAALGVEPKRQADPDRLLKPAAYTYVNKLGEEFEYVNLILLLIGMLTRGREWLDRRRFPMLIMFGGTLAAVWVRLMHFGDINGRYFLTTYLVAIPTEAFGILFVIDRAKSWSQGRTRRRRVPAAVPVVVLLGLSTMFGVKLFMTGHGKREEQAALGRRLGEQLPPFRIVEVDRSSVRVGHFALGSLPSVAYDDEGDGPPPPPPDVIIVQAPANGAVRERAARYGLVETSLGRTGPSGNGFHVFARPATSRRTAMAHGETDHGLR